MFLASTVLGQEDGKKPIRPRNRCAAEPCVSKVLRLPNSLAEWQLQFAAIVFRTIAGIKDVSTDAAERTIAVKATPEQLAIAEKLVSVMEALRQPGSHASFIFVQELKASAPQSTLPEPLPSSIESRNSCERNTCLIKVLYLPEPSGDTPLQDVVNTVRTIAEFSFIVPDPSTHTISLKGTAEQFAIAERLIEVLESLRSSRSQERSSVLLYELKQALPEPAVSEKFTEQVIANMRTSSCEFTTCYIKALYLPDATMGQLSNLVNKVRSSTQMSRTVPMPTRHVIVIRGTAEQVAIADKVLKE